MEVIIYRSKSENEVVAGKRRHFAEVLHTDWILTERSEWAVHSTSLPGHAQGKTQVELEVSKLGGEGGVMNRNSRNSRNK